MKRSVLSLFVSASLFLAAGAALADTHTGVVTQIDRGSKAIVVKSEENNRKQRFFLSRFGTITRAGQPVAFSELKRGDRVELELPRKGSAHTVHSVAIVGEKAEAIATRE